MPPIPLLHRDRAIYGVAQPQPKRPGLGRPPKHTHVLSPDLSYATVCNKRQTGRVVEVTLPPIFATVPLLGALLNRRSQHHDQHLTDFDELYYYELIRGSWS